MCFRKLREVIRPTGSPQSIHPAPPPNDSLDERNLMLIVMRLLRLVNFLELAY